MCRKMIVRLERKTTTEEIKETIAIGLYLHDYGDVTLSQVSDEVAYTSRHYDSLLWLVSSHIRGVNLQFHGHPHENCSDFAEQPGAVAYGYLGNGLAGPNRARICEV